jgi:8-oxo-dGTP pyrophosphatase MutT (NUDIX family)
VSVRANVPDELKPSASAGVVVLRRAGAGWTCLLLRAYRNWDFPKGLLEDDESPREAAIREVWEETDLGDLRFRWGDLYRETLPYAGGKIARYYIAESPQGEVRLKVSAELGRPEHDEYRWVTFDAAEDLLPPRLAIILEWARELAAADPDDR